MPDAPSLLAVDTSPWIALLADEPDRAEHVQRLVERAERGECRLFVSTVTITEIVKGPQAGDPLLSQLQERVFTDFMDNPFVTLVSVDPFVAALARDLRRAIAHLKTPDAIIVATAQVAGAEVLYTYDERDLLRLDGEPAMRGLRILPPPIEHQLPLALLPRTVPPAEERSDE